MKAETSWRLLVENQAPALAEVTAMGFPVLCRLVCCRHVEAISNMGTSG